MTISSDWWAWRASRMHQSESPGHAPFPTQALRVFQINKTLVDTRIFIDFKCLQAECTTVGELKIRSKPHH
ncbi:hypothetical protein Y032_0025g1141 [Ancylostoma ceylanicum]|nr:hypothetical protein Y032_0025g1141 [Ancylostoma ceylanicum]